MKTKPPVNRENDMDCRTVCFEDVYLENVSTMVENFFSDMSGANIVSASLAYSGTKWGMIVIYMR